MTSKAPRHIRFRLLNVNDNIGVKIRFWFTERNRKDVYADNTLVKATNTGVDANGKLTVLRATGTDNPAKQAVGRLNVTLFEMYEAVSDSLTSVTIISIKWLWNSSVYLLKRQID